MKRLIALAGQVKTSLAIVMPSPAASPLARDIAAALDWWREAGVDAAFSDHRRKWLKEPEAPAPPQQAREAATQAAPAPACPRIGGDRAHWPQDLAAFQQWWLAEPLLDEGGLSPRVAPRGAAGAALMVLVAMPAETDCDLLLSGKTGALLDGFLSAAGLAPDQVYRASVLPRHTPLPGWDELLGGGLDAVLAHHVQLVRPQRLLVFGRNILPLCGHDPAQGAQKSRSFNHEGGRIPALHEVGLDRLLEKPGLRSRFWQRWLDWTDGQTWDDGHG